MKSSILHATRHARRARPTIGRYRGWVLPLLAASFLAGCVNLGGDGEQARLFLLTPKSQFSDDLPTVDWQLEIELPFAATGINTTRVALRHSPTELEYFAGASWTDLAPVMVQSLIIESFDNSERITAVDRDSIGLRSDYVLRTDLREFQAEYDAQERAMVHVQLNAKLVRMPERAIVGSATFDRSVAASDASLTAVIEAFDTALGKVLRRTVEWTLRIGEEKADQARY